MGPEKAMATIAATLKVTTPGGAFVCVVFGETNKLADNIQLRLYHRTYSAAGLTNTVSSEITGDYQSLLEFTEVFRDYQRANDCIIYTVAMLLPSVATVACCTYMFSYAVAMLCHAVAMLLLCCCYAAVNYAIPMHCW